MGFDQSISWMKTEEGGKKLLKNPTGTRNLGEFGRNIGILDVEI